MTTATVMVSGDVAESTEVLPHCPYHAQIDAFRAFRDEFLEVQGLLDLQEFEVRREIVDREKAVAIEELVYREDTKMIISGAKRMVNVAAEYYELYTNVYHSNNWATEFDRLKSLNFMQFGMDIYTTFGKASALWAEAQYAAAGKAVADGLFPTPQEKSGNLTWDPLPYNKPFPGEQIAGYVGGIIYQFTGAKSTNDLSTCIAAQDDLLKSFDDAADTLMKRYNDDLITGVSDLNEIFKNLDASVAECSQLTIDEVKKVQERVAAVEDEVLLSNVTDNKNHIELTYAKMKMAAEEHDFFNYGANLAEFYLTASQN